MKELIRPPIGPFKNGGVLRLDEALGGMFAASPEGKVYLLKDGVAHEVTDDVTALMYCLLKHRPCLGVVIHGGATMHVRATFETPTAK